MSETIHPSNTRRYRKLQSNGQLRTMKANNDRRLDSSSSHKHHVDSSVDTSNVKIVWYLVTDSKKLRHFAIQKYGHHKVIANIDIQPEHSAKEFSHFNVSIEGFRNSIAEWWLYGK